MRIVMLLMLLLIPAAFYGQTVVGRITDSNTGEPLSDAAVRWVKSKVGTTSNASGEFSLALSVAANDSLEISHIGYVSQRLAASDSRLKKSLRIELTSTQYLVSPFVVTATRVETDLMRIPQKIIVIDSIALHALPLQSIDDALVYSSGVMIDRPMGIFAAKSIVTMRGLSGSEQGRTLVLLDGIPINKSDGGTVNFNLVDPLLTDRIEIVKGPMSALYGGNAMGGVVNIISSTPTEKLAGRVKLSYGTFNTMSGNASINGFAGKTPQRGFFWSGGMLWRKSDGYISEPEYARTEYTVPVFVSEQIFSLKTGYKFSDKKQLWISGMYFNDERGGGEKVFEELGSFSEHDSYHIRSCYKAQTGKWNLTSQAYYLRENYAKINEYVKSGEYTLYDVDSKRSDLGLITHLSRNIGKSHLLTTGFELRQGAVDAADVYHTSTDKIINAGIMDMAAVFMQDEFVFGKERWKLVAGIRYDYAGFRDGQFSVENPSTNNLYLQTYVNDNMAAKKWNSLSPKLAIQYLSPKQTKVFASYSHGFRAPILDDLCRSGKTRGGFQVANSNLVPETLDNIELGVRKQLLGKLSVEPTLYFSIGHDFMYPVGTGDTVDMGYAAPVIVTSNVSEVQIAGFEFDFNYKASKNLNVFFNYAFAHSVVTDYTPATAQQTDITGLFLSNVPKHLANLGFQFMYKNAGISVNTRYVGSRWVNDTNTLDEKYGLPAQYDTYITADLRLWKNFGKHWLLGASVVNVADKIYTDSKGQRCPGRLVLVEAGFKF